MLVRKTVATQEIQFGNEKWEHSIKQINGYPSCYPSIHQEIMIKESPKIKTNIKKMCVRKTHAVPLKNENGTNVREMSIVQWSKRMV